MKLSNEELFPWLKQEWLERVNADEEGSTHLGNEENDGIDEENAIKYKAKSLNDGFARGFVIAGGKSKFVSAVPDLPKERLEAFCSDLEKYQPHQKLMPPTLNSKQ